MSRVLVLCPNAWDREALARPQVRAEHEVLLAGEELLNGVTPWNILTFDVDRWMDRTAARFAGAGLNAVVGTGDYPGSMLAAGVAERLGLPSAGLRPVVRLSHKLISREIQREAAPEATPDFEPVDPFSTDTPRRLPYPYFLKPVKGTMSIRAQLVRNADERRSLLSFSLRERIQKLLLLRPFQQLLDRYTEGTVAAHYFVAESPLAGDQVTVDGFVQRGEVTIQGVVHSFFYPGTMSFKRFQYPSPLPQEVQARMADVVTRVIRRSGLDNTCFNVELFHDPATGGIHLIEINPRMSYQFCDLYERVDGTSSYDVQIRLALGQPARWTRGAGKDRAAASFVMRTFRDAVVRSDPGEEQVRRVKERWPGTIVNLLAHRGERLSQHDQDVGSFRLAIVNMGAPSLDALEAGWAEAERMLPFELSPLP
ncbi:MAG TPA: ATP-grasp domain-containing protein [Myxococcales bacterium]|nr:ATP-grasp domain-containing protein [Myxococcales bacterium]